MSEMLFNTSRWWGGLALLLVKEARRVSIVWRADRMTVDRDLG